VCGYTESSNPIERSGNIEFSCSACLFVALITFFIYLLGCSINESNSGETTYWPIVPALANRLLLLLLLLCSSR
jgi:hypothetical protein